VDIAVIIGCEVVGVDVVVDMQKRHMAAGVWTLKLDDHKLVSKWGRLSAMMRGGDACGFIKSNITCLVCSLCVGEYF
jgi:hypothetical protein